MAPQLCDMHSDQGDSINYMQGSSSTPPQPPASGQNKAAPGKHPSTPNTLNPTTSSTPEAISQQTAANGAFYPIVQLQHSGQGYYLPVQCFSHSWQPGTQSGQTSATGQQYSGIYPLAPVSNGAGDHSAYLTPPPPQQSQLHQAHTTFSGTGSNQGYLGQGSSLSSLSHQTKLLSQNCKVVLAKAKQENAAKISYHASVVASAQSNLKLLTSISSLQPPNSNPETTDSFLEMGIKVYQKRDPARKLASVVITFDQGDRLYSETCVSDLYLDPAWQTMVYECRLASHMELFYRALADESSDEIHPNIKKIVDDIDGLEPKCVLFNWETGPNIGETYKTGNCMRQLLGLIVKRGYMANFTGASLSSLYCAWNQQIMGRKPFSLVPGTHIQKGIYKFDKNVLSSCPLPQFRALAQLCRIEIATLRQEIIQWTLALDQDCLDEDEYIVQVLSINLTENQHQLYDHQHLYEIGGELGEIVNLLIEFDSGARFLLNMQPLYALDYFEVAEADLAHYIAKHEGSSQGTKFKAEIEKLPNEEEKVWAVRDWAIDCMVKASICPTMKH